MPVNKVYSNRAEMGDAYQKAEIALDVRRYDLAIQLMRDVLREHPENGLAFHTMARAYTLKKDNLTALKAVRESLRLDPNNITAMTLLASLLRDMKQYPEAERVLLGALQLDPNYPQVHYIYAAFLLHQKKDVARAKFHALKALELDAADYRFHVMYGRVLAGECKLNEADAEYSAGLRLAPDNFRMLNSYGGYLLEFRNQPREAFEFIRQAMMREPNDEEVRKNFTIALKAKHPFYSLAWNLSLIKRRGANGWGQKSTLVFVAAMVIIMVCISSVLFVSNPVMAIISPILAITATTLLILLYVYVLLAVPIFNFLVRRGLIK